jgi:Tol biopolymer transport system component
MLRGALLSAVLLALFGLGAQQSHGAGSHPRNGVIAYAHVGETGKRFQIYTTNVAGTHRRRLTNGRKFSSSQPSYSPNGKRIVFVRNLHEDDLWTMNASGRSLHRLTWTKRIEEDSPVWSPDGKQIAFVVAGPDDHVSPEQGIWVIGADGHGRRRLTDDFDTSPSWSPDGSEIVFARGDPNSQTVGIYVVPAAGGTPTRISAPDQPGGTSDWGPAWSPDGSRILFSSDRPDTFRADLWVMSPDGSDVEQVTNTEGIDETEARWSPDGRKIVYVGEPAFHGSVSWQVFVSDANGANRRNVTHSCGQCTILNVDPSWQPLR